MEKQKKTAIQGKRLILRWDSRPAETHPRGALSGKLACEHHFQERDIDVSFQKTCQYENAQEQKIFGQLREKQLPLFFVEFRMGEGIAVFQ